MKLFHNSCAQTSFKQSKMLNKMFHKGGRKKFYLTPMTYNTPSSAATKNKSKYQSNPCKLRRTEQVSKVLFSYISDLIQYGDDDFSQIEESIDISKVKISPDFSALVVHWVATGTEKDDIIQQMLMKNSSRIRQHLINLRVVGTLPPITFVPDLSEVQYQIVINLLKMADMGPEYDRLSGEDLLKQQPQVLSKCVSGSLEKQIKENLNDMSEKSFSDKNTMEHYKKLKMGSEKTDQHLPQVDSDLDVVNQFENNVYELDHLHLMQLVKEKQHGVRKSSLAEMESESVLLSNQKFIEQYSEMVAKKKKRPRKLKEYTYDQYLKEENNFND